MKTVRFLIHVDGNWQVTFTCPQAGADWQRTRQLRKIPVPRTNLIYPRPLPEDLPPEPNELCVGDDHEPLHQVYLNIVGRTPREGEVQLFGNYLFETLIGRDMWAEINDLVSSLGAQEMELALSWARTEGNLHRLNWEMMYGINNFLAAEISRGVAITRVVADGASVSARHLSLPPRVLFVIGTSLTNEKIRPGAEAFGLLRKLEEEKRTVNVRILQKATQSKIKAEVKRFKPDVVHFICHGYVDPDTGRGFLELMPDTVVNSDGVNYGNNLIDCLIDASNELPPIVVLSACYSGTGVTKMLGAHEIAPLAAELVHGGVPIVVGMAGRVSDLGCRLFTRRFGAALIVGQSIVSATAEARRATFYGGKPPEDSADWALPAVFLAGGLTEDYVPAQLDQADMAVTVRNWIRAYDVDRFPVFCGRERFLDAYHDLMDTGRGVLVVYVNEERVGFGRTRLLQEFTAQAVRDGHIPCLIGSDRIEWKRPKNLREFARILHDATRRAREVFHLGIDRNSQLILMNLTVDKMLEKPELDPDIRYELENDGKLSTEVVKMAIHRDLSKLLEDARREHPTIKEGQGQVIVLFDDVDQYGREVINTLLKELIGPFGLGTQDNPVPVVAVFSLAGAATEVLRPWIEKPVPEPWLRREALKKFETDGEDILAYEHVLLNAGPHISIARNSSTPWAMNYEAGEEISNEWIKNVREWLDGLPSDFYNKSTYILVQMGQESGFLIPADDESRLKSLQEEMRKLRDGI